MSEQVTHNNLPSAVGELIEMVRDMQKKIADLSTTKGASDQWLSLSELIEYLPSRPARSTIYAYTRNGTIPFSKSSNKLTFRKSLIDLWIAGEDWKKGEVKIDASELMGKRKLRK